jgi:hypothetical protein
LLEKPSENNTWVCCLVEVIKFEWRKGKPGLHIIERAQNEGPYLLAICISNESLHKHSLYFQKPVQLPDDHEIKLYTYDARGATQNTRLTYVQNGVKGIEKYGLGLLKLYRQITLDRQPLVPMERLSLTQEIMVYPCDLPMSNIDHSLEFTA